MIYSIITQTTAKKQQQKKYRKKRGKLRFRESSKKNEMRKSLFTIKAVFIDFSDLYKNATFFFNQEKINKRLLFLGNENYP